ncbi:MerR family transcriptional regulator [Denitrobaculum tricleocarpae]|uniref:MerR family transcriptional regulator n=1 Tax=Denitrobaculum tricleocarpae TaxID=2591009 RepID=A0A545TL53_9PROT|nr:MerR family transcriptional regulator [Denitrobaculum tricleocarpae]TQV77949.1 MerR family transcriptional regulator [Denitrobaculum tricleocarpae]
MKTQIEEYSVGQLARLSGVSVRTLHHYDEIGLLKPAYVADNGYRFYRRAEWLRLQEILFYRDAGLPLAEAARLLDEPVTAIERLLRHRNHLQEQNRRTAQIIDTLTATIDHLEGKRDMEINELYKPFSASRQAEYEAWLTSEYGAEMAAGIAASKASVEKLPEGMAGAMAQLREIESDLVASYEAGGAPDADRLHDQLERHRDWVEQMWGRACDAEAFAGLADMYWSHPDFVARYEKLSPRFSGWLPAAMKAHAARLERGG